MECLICYQEFQQDKRPCKCKICSPCFSNWVTSQIFEINYTLGDEIKCGECQQQFSFESILKNDSLAPTCKNIINEALTKKYLRNSPEFFPCPTQNCQNGGFIDNDKCDRTQKIKCETCSISYKLPKKQPFSLKKSVQNFYQNGFSQLKKYQSTKKCPYCSTNIEKNGGCSHMTCIKCNKHFCWNCLDPMVTHNSFKCTKIQQYNQKKNLAITISIISIIGSIIALLLQMLGILNIILGILWGIILIIFQAIKYFYKYCFAYNIVIIGIGSQIFIGQQFLEKVFVYFESKSYQQQWNSKTEAFKNGFDFIGILIVNYAHIRFLEWNSASEFSFTWLINTFLADFIILFVGFLALYLYRNLPKLSTKNNSFSFFQKEQQLQIYEERKRAILAEIEIQHNNQNQEQQQQQEEIQ